MRKILITAILSFLICFPFVIVEAQDKLQKTIPELTVTNPETASLGRYGNIPMNLYTGTANISVPLYNLNFDGLEIPIDLSYNTGGIRPTQEATRVGLGWTLSCEPVITRQIKGGCDISVPFGTGKGYVYTDVPLPTFGDGNQSGWDIKDKLPAAFNLYYYPENHESGLDTEPDIFTLNIFGESVSFVLTQKALNNNIIGVKMINGDKRYKIEYIEKDQTFLVTNDRGFKFYFIEKEYSIAAIYQESNGYVVVSEKNNKLITGWKLNKVVSPRNKVLAFKYSQSIIHGHPQETNYRLNVPWGHSGIASDYIFNNNFGYSSSYNGYILNYLDSITSDNATVEFAGSERLDIFEEVTVPYETSNMANFIGVSTNKPKKVDNIIIKNSLGDVIVDYKFNYSYFDQDQINDKYSKRKLRLKLDQIDLNSTFYRSFSYLNPNQLPDKSQRTDDFWGFYNGDNHSFTSFPTFSMPFNEIAGVVYRYKVVGGNRKPNFEFGKNGLLENIKYPTGGYTKLTYEANDIKVDKNNIGKFELYELVEPKKMAHIESLDSVGKLSDVFEIKNAAGAELSLNITFGMGGHYDYTEPGSSNIKYTVEEKDKQRVAYQVIDVSTGKSVLNGYFTETQGPSGTPLGPSLGLNWNKKSNRVNLNKGKYQIKATGLRHISNLFAENEGATNKHPDYYKIYKCSVKVDAFIHALADEGTINLKIGGVRIKSIEDCDNNNVSLTKKEYKYTSEDGKISSGILIDDITFSNIRSLVYSENPPKVTTYPPTLSLEVYSNSILKSPSSNHIGYSRVEEISIDSKSGSQNNGKTVSEFVNKPNKYSNFLDAPLNMIFTRPLDSYGIYTNRDLALFPTYSYQDINGKLIKEEHYNSMNTKVKESIFEYNYNYYDMQNIAHPSAIGTGLAQYFKKNYENVGGKFVCSSSPVYVLQIYKIISENVSLISRTDTEYNNGIAVSKKITYQYNDQFQTKKITENSSEPTKNIETEILYPTDLVKVEQIPLMEQLINNNIIFEPVSSKRKIGTTQILNSHTKYKEASITYKEGTQNATKNLIVPDVKYERTTGDISLGSSDANNRTIKYDKYDSQGKLVQFTALEQAPVCYVWGYNGQYPIAKIENATYSQITSIITEASLKSISEKITPGATDMQTINGLRTNANLTDAMVTTYTYKPLVGMLTATDPRGITTYYDYDAFGRLKEAYIIENGVKKIIQVNEYHYQNQ